MRDFGWFNTFMTAYKDEIIEYWLKGVEDTAPGIYDLNELHKNGEIYFNLLSDIHIPLEQHEFFEIIARMCLYHAERNTPIEDLIISSHIWREAIFKFFWMYINEQKIPLSELERVTPLIHKKIDDLQRVVVRTYLDYSKSIINQKDKKITDLHNDRLSMLGKMGASMAHELRNPLTAIEGFLKLLRGGLSDESLKEVANYLDIIEFEFKGLYRQISGFLSFSKNNGLEEPFSQCGNKELIESVVELIKPRCIDENIELILSIENHFSLIIQRVAVQQVLLNLFNNAIDELQTIDTPRVISIHSFEGKERYYISVTDNGNGIPDELKDTIFEPFTTGKQNGTGLGLSICKSIMEKNVGDISFSSKKGLTTFTMSLKKDCGLKATSNIAN